MAASTGARGADLIAERTRVIAAPSALVWAIAGDSNRWDRIVGAGPSSYHIEPAPDGGSLYVGRGTLAGLPVSWIERGEWIEGRYVLGERRYLTGPLSVASYRIEVTADDGGTRVDLRTYLRPAQPIPDGLAAAMQDNLERAAERYLDAIDAMLTAGELPAHIAGEPAASFGRRAIQSMEPGKVVGGRRSDVNEENLDYAAAKLFETGVDDDHAARIVEFLRARPDFELEQVRPFELARAWGIERRDLLRSFLHAATAGLFDLRWQLNCPRCRVGADDAPSVSAIGRRGHCGMCDINFEVDFASNVEAVFRANSAIRELRRRIYCASSPWFRPHVFAVIELGPGESRDVRLPDPALGFVARSLRGQAYLQAAVGTRRVNLDGDGLHGESGAPDSAVTVVNDTDSPRTLLLERLLADADAARGTDILTLPEFLDLFAMDAPASGEDLTISSVAVLFSDLTHTTELYRTLGDSRAFALVHEHFRDMRRIIAEHGGAMLKTMGDAIMASFTSPGDAVAAGLAMSEATRTTHGEHVFHLKVGVHHGPCVMVRANGRVDLFGTTVNIAWRLQEQARANQVVLLASLLEHREVARILAERALVAEPVEVVLKGLGAGYELAVINADGGGD